MSEAQKSIKVAFDEETEQRLKTAATSKGVTVELFCSEAIVTVLSCETIDWRFSA